MKTPLISLLLFLASVANAETFEERVKAADAAEAHAAYASYQKLLSDPLQESLSDAMTPCLADLGDAKPDDFTLVADISENGTTSDVAVMPETTFSMCVAKTFLGVHLPKPPKHPFPIDFKIRLHNKG